ncbi:hypothetical protein KAFR_0E04100 [Kazachstania africana CBS 2517]|uniref:Manganese/iron superoxide dismutase C-terminal domain-containing protein n=1 Tax=Kazachstania africana (strain ATCC 22294 / BCRC 22015 / CBS 2517 / CECT 1963 / NBRC 1671 / NRRL Y-8276) TaxID=1071382 RepID=H2AW11_KAZAF|nr:hypothetical protein KAFR_0E04100 [Kazachstania africana CBS 2517]CCF58561.1 hypothetical protein KAFR_0E04100 [Kazachstania africana CBS 2517]
MLSSRGIQAARPSQRWFQTVALEHLQRNEPLRGIFSAKGLETSWFKRIEMYTSKLNDLTRNNTELQNMPIQSVITNNLNSFQKKDIVTFASLIYNLTFAMKSLKGCNIPLPDKLPGSQELLKTVGNDFSNEPINVDFIKEIENSFGSVIEFRTLLLNSNLAIQGDGCTWLLARKFQNKFMNATATDEVTFDKLFILNTYNGGSPFNYNRIDMINKYKAEYNKINKQAPPENDIISLEEAQLASIEKTVYIPLLAIDASPKSWLTDYGVFGKREYLNRVWESVDWNVVQSRLPKKSNIVYD